MAVVFDASLEGLQRTSGFPTPTGDAAHCWWFFFDGTFPAAGQFRTLWFYTNAAKTQFVWMRMNDAGRVALNISGTTAAGSSPLTPGLHPVGYTRTGNTHRLYVDSSLVQTTTVNITTYVITDEFLGTDSVTATSWAASQAAAYKAFDVALSLTQLFAEWRSAALVTSALSGDLIVATPLSTDLVATTGTDWSAVGIVSFAAMSPTNFLAEFATVIAAFPSDTVQDPLYTGAWLWFTGTTPASTNALGVLPWAEDAAAYRPIADLYTGTVANATIGAVGTRRPVQMTIDPGQVFFVRVRDGNTTTPLGGVLTLRVDALITSPVFGAVVIPPDGVTEPAVVISALTGEVLYLHSFTAGETGDSLVSSGHMLQFEKLTSPAKLHLYDSTFTDLLTVTLLAGGAPDPLIRANVAGTHWWVVDANGTIYKIDATGTIVLTTGPITSTPGAIIAIGTSPDESILYYQYELGFGRDAEVWRWNLLTNTEIPGALFTLPLPSAFYGTGRDLLVTESGDLLVYNATIDGSDSFVYRFSSAGALAATYTFTPGADSLFLNHINRGQTWDTFWTWQRSFGGQALTVLTEINIATGAIVSGPFSVPEAGYAPVDLDNAKLFGPVDSCPFYLFFEGEAPECPGERGDPRTDGLPYSPVIVDPCAGSGTRGAARTGA